MRKNAGLWIDHATALIVNLDGDSSESRRINSDLANHPHSDAIADDIRQDVETEYLKRFYDEIINTVSDAKSLFIFGPGEAKGELEKRIIVKHLQNVELHIEATDKMTDAEIIAKVRSHFDKDSLA